MKFAILSDIHGNLFALQECFKYIDNMNIDAIIWCGDYITDIPRAHEVINFIKEKSKQYKSFIIKGNREDYILDYHNTANKKWSMQNRGGPLLCCYQELSKKDLAFLSSLPDTCMIDIPDIPKIFISHKRNYEEEKDYKFKIFGHSHEQSLFAREDIQYINPGSVGLAIGTQGKACFSVLEITKKDTKIQNYQVKYNINQPIKAIQNDKISQVTTKWGEGIIKTLETGIDYSKLYVEETLRIAKEYGFGENLDTIPIEVWHEARKSIGLER